MKTVFLIENPKHALLYAVTFKKSVSKNHHYIVNNEQYSDAIILYGFKKLVRLITPDEYSKEYNINKLNKVPMSTRLLDFMIIQDKSDQYKIMKQHLDEADEIIIATDPDLEDEDIARYLIRHSKNHNNNIKRFRFNSLDGNDINFSYSQIKDVSELTNREMAKILEKQNLRVPHFMIYQEVLDLIYLYFKDLISMCKRQLYNVGNRQFKIVGFPTFFYILFLSPFQKRRNEDEKRYSRRSAETYDRWYQTKLCSLSETIWL